jgi:pimeloyl-ACP methyl ester carboxylesterase
VRVTVGDTKLFFDAEGASLVPDGPRMRERPTVVLIHGGPGGDHSEFKPAVSALADCAQLVYLDLRGQGRSDPSLPDTWNLRTWAADIRSFCDALEIERPVVLGASFGGFVALQYAIDYPDHPSKLILLSTAARMNLQYICDAMARFGGEEQRAVAERFLTDPTEENEIAYDEVCGPLHSVPPPDPDFMTRMVWRPEIGRQFMATEELTFDHREGAARVKCPVLVVTGARDPITPVESGAELAQSLPADLVEFVTIENVSHNLARNAPDAHGEVVRLLRRFITGRSASSHRAAAADGSL